MFPAVGRMWEVVLREYPGAYGRVAQIRNPNIEMPNKSKILMSKSGNPILTQSEQFWSFDPELASGLVIRACLGFRI